MPKPGNVKVADYYDVVHRASWTRRTASTLAGGTLGAMYGVVIGIAAAFLPAIFKSLGLEGAETAAMPDLTGVAKSAALFAGIGGFTGIAGVQLVASESGAVAAGFEEKEQREKLEGRALLTPVRSVKAEKAEAESWSPSVFNWRVAALTVPLFAAFGAIVGYSGLLGKEALVGTLSGSAAATAAGASVAGMFGACIGFKNSLSTNKMVNFYMRGVEGKFFGGEKLRQENVAIAAPSPQVALLAEEPALAEKSYVATTRRFSLQAVMEGTEINDPGLTRLH